MENIVLCDDDAKELGKFYTKEEVQAIAAFVEPLCATGRLYIARIFVRGRIIRKEPKSFAEIMNACRVAWVERWQYGSPGRLADVDDTTILHDRTASTENPECHGWQNAVAFFSVYGNLGLPMPKFLF